MRARTITGPGGSRLILPAAAAALVVVVVLSAAVLGPLPKPTGAGQPASPARPVACTSTVHADVLSGNGAVTLGYLPAGFRLKVGNPGDIGLGQSGRPLTYQKSNGPNRFPSGLTISPRPAELALGSDVIGQTNDKYSQASVIISGHRGLILTGIASTNPRIVVEWRATANTSMSVNAFLVTRAQVLAVARALRFHPPRVLQLPLVPGSVVSRAEAISAATKAGGDAVGAKLTSFTEVSSLIQGELRISADLGEPGGLAAAPWKPIWAVLLAKTSTNLVIVDAASGEVEWRTSAPVDAGWFDALTDRASHLPGCPGGTTARVPFGVLTRSEELYAEPGFGGRLSSGATVSTQYKLASVPALNRTGEGDGCMQYCSLEQVEWVRLTVTRARGGGTIVCPIPRIGPGKDPSVVEYTEFSVGNGSGISCSAPEQWYLGLTDLAPPLPG